MRSDISSATQPAAPVRRPHLIVWHGPVLLALLALGGIYIAISESLSPGPRGLILALIVVLLLPFGLSLRMGHVQITRALAFAILGLLTVAEAASASLLVLSLVANIVRLPDLPHDAALALLRDAGLIWVANMLTFALWYWEIDGGGPGRRRHEPYHSDDFVFPQMALARPEGAEWCPHFVDYLFLAFNTSTAFSPTDTLILSRRAKLLLMTQSLISLTVLAILAARAINTL